VATKKVSSISASPRPSSAKAAALTLVLVTSASAPTWAQEPPINAPLPPTPSSTDDEHAPSPNDPGGGAPPAEPAKRPGDNWPDVSHFLDRVYGFLPIASPITEPAVGYGAAGGLMFLSKSFGDAAAGLGRPNITFVGGMGTENGSWGLFGGDIRYWLKDHLQTFTALIYASVNLDFYGVGWTDALEDAPLRYNLAPKGGLFQAKYRFGESSFWAGLGGQFISTEVAFAAPAGTPELPDYSSTTNLGGGTVLAAYDTRNNVFTTTRGTYAEANFGVFGAAPDGEGAFERMELLALQFVPLPHRFFLGVRGQFLATFGMTPFYFRPSIGMRGVAAMRYQGEEVAQIEAELRWQFWGRLSLLGFWGAGGAWNHFEHFEASQGVFAAGGGFRYELARKYGIHAGIDVGGSKDTAAFYVQVGSAWGRP